MGTPAVRLLAERVFPRARAETHTHIPTASRLLGLWLILRGHHTQKCVAPILSVTDAQLVSALYQAVPALPADDSW